MKSILAGKRRKKWNARNWTVFIVATLGLIYILVFHYVPMVGVLLGFKDADYSANLLGALLFEDWVGFDHFVEFLHDVDFWNVMTNTLVVNVIMLLVNFFAPILFALLINEVKHAVYKKGIHVVATFPNFISWAIYGGIVIALTDQTTGIMNPILNLFGLSSEENPVYLMGNDYIWAVIIVSSLIKTVGWGSIIYMAAIASVDVQLYEAAELDGINRWQKAIYITLPSIKPTILFALVMLTIGGFNVFTSIKMITDGKPMHETEVILTWMYSKAFNSGEFGYAAALSFIVAVTLIFLAILQFKAMRNRDAA